MLTAKLNVIITTYNDFRYLEVISHNFFLFNQDPNVEKIVIVSDGSTTSFEELLKKRFPAENLLLLQKNVGLHRARMAGVSSLRQGYCLFVDSDDVINDNYSFQGPGVFDFWGSKDGLENRVLEAGKINAVDSLSHQIITGVATGVIWNKTFDVESLKEVPRLYLRNAEDYFVCLWLRDYIDSLPYVKIPITTYMLSDNSLSKAPTRTKYLHIWKALLWLIYFKKISFKEFLILIWHLIVRNFIRSFLKGNNKTREILSLFGIGR